MPASSDALWAFFVVAALGLTILVVAFAAAVAVSQRRFLALHRDYGQRLLMAQDEERAWVAREVHDDAIQRLALFSHELDRWGAGGALGEQGRRQLSGLRQEVEDLTGSLRGLAHRLHPAALDHGTIQLALEQAVDEARRVTGLAVDAEFEAIPPVRTPGTVLAAYRIVQEALRNAGRHAGVDRVAVSATADRQQLRVVIRDQGRGFDADRGPGRSGSGIGLQTMRERARLAGGDLTIASRPGQGTVIRLTLPLEPADDA